MPAAARFEIAEGATALSSITAYETMDCPHCQYRIPVKAEWLDWQKIANHEREHASYIRKVYEAYIADLKENCPEVAIYIHNSTIELRQKLQQYLDRYRDPWIDDTTPF